MVPKWCPDVKNKVVKRKTATITRYKKSLCLQGFSQITYKKICGNTGRFWLFHDPRNQFDSNVAWVRLPPSAPKAAPCGVLFSVFIASFARWDSNSPCPALCAPPGCKNPVGCCKGAGTPIICTISDVESKDFTADALGGFSGATTPSSVGESKKDYIVKRSSGIMKVRSANCTNKIPGGL